MALSLSTTLDLKSPAREKIALSLIACIMAIFRIASMQDVYPDSFAASMANSANNYNPGSGFPPFPGSPLLILAIRIFIFLGFSDHSSLVLPSIFSCSLAVFPLFNIVKRIFGQREAWLSAMIYALHPGVLAFSLLPGSNAILLFPLLLGIRLTLRTAFLSLEERDKTRFISHYAGTAVFAFSIGLSSDAIPFLVIPLILAIKSAFTLRKFSGITETLNGYLIGIAIWAVPFLLRFSIGDLFLHASEMQPLFTDEHRGITSKLAQTVYGVFIYGQSLSCKSIFCVLPVIIMTPITVAGLLMSVKSRGVNHLILFGAVPVVAALFKPEPEIPSSFSMLFPLSAIFISRGITKLVSVPKLSIVPILIVFSVLFVDRLVTIRSNKPVIVLMKEYIEKNYLSDDVVIFCGPIKNALKKELEQFRIYRIESLDELQAPRYSRLSNNRTVLFCSDIKGMAASNQGLFSKKESFNYIKLFEGNRKPLTLFMKNSTQNQH